MAKGAGATDPVPVRRRISVARGARWEFIGWTALDHPRSRPGIEGRKKVWRNDTGSLSYKPADENEDIPSFEQDAGTYEID